MKGTVLYVHFLLSLLVIRILKFIAFLSSLAMIKCLGEIRKYLWKINVAVTVAVKAVLELPLYGCASNCQSKKKCAAQVKKKSRARHKCRSSNLQNFEVQIFTLKKFKFLGGRGGGGNRAFQKN